MLPENDVQAPLNTKTFSLLVWHHVLQQVGFGYPVNASKEHCAIDISNNLNHVQQTNSGRGAPALSFHCRSAAGSAIACPHGKARGALRHLSCVVCLGRRPLHLWQVFPWIWLVAICRACFNVEIDAALTLRFGLGNGSHLSCTLRLVKLNYTEVLHHSVAAAVLIMQLLCLCF